MRLLSRLFSRSRPPFTADQISKINFGEYFYLLNYRESYREVLGGVPNEETCLSELFLFRAWTAQFGSRLYTSYPELSDRVIYEIVNSGKYLGHGLFRDTHGVDIEAVLGADFISLLDNRWQAYDRVVETHRDPGKIPIMQIVAVLCDLCNLHDARKTYALCVDFWVQMETIKQDALRMGLLASGRTGALRHLTRRVAHLVLRWGKR